MVNWDAQDLEKLFSQAGFDEVHVVVEANTNQQRISADQLSRWFAQPERGIAGDRPSYAGHLLRRLTPVDLERARALFASQLRDQWVMWATNTAFVSAHLTDDACPKTLRSA